MTSRGMFDLSGKVVLVTGGGSGIGRAYCEATAEFGADIVCADLVLERAEETAAMIRESGHRALAVKTNASVEQDIRAMVEKCVEAFDGIDVVFANAGIMEKNKVMIHDEPIEDWDSVMAVQPRGTFLLMKAAFPIMMAKRRGSFIATASIGGLTPTSLGGGFDLLTAYNTSKAAVIMLIKMATKQYGPYGIRVNAICPGYHRTSLGREETRAAVEQTIIASTPLKRVGLPEDLKGLAVWLASDASSFVSGQTFVQDGGMIA